MPQLLESVFELERHEEIFVQRYERMLKWSLYLTNQDRTQAEDLLHDAYVQFTLVRPDLQSIQNLDGYLYGILRMLRLSQLRRAARVRLHQLSIVECDSAELALRLHDPHELIGIHDDLRAICRYACLRKESSKAGSILILRFFHGYYPSEITRVLRSSRKVVDMRLAAARREAKLYLTAPDRFSLIDQRPAQEAPSPMSARNTTDLLRELRATIFRSRQGDCFSSEQIQQLYQETGETALTGAQLSHLVSCPDCLDQVNQILGFPLLADRLPTEMLGPDNRPPQPPDEGGPADGSGGGPGDETHLKKESRRRARETFEHRPQELRIAVNGSILGSQKIHAAISEQTLEPPSSEAINFIEVFSEQEKRLLLLPVKGWPPEEQTELTTKVVLSDDRTLELNFYLRDSHPVIQVVYCDPLLQTEDELLFDPEEEITYSELIGPDRHRTAPAVSDPAPRGRTLAGWFNSLFGFLWTRPRQTPPSILSTYSATGERSLWFRPAWVGALLIVFLLASALLVHVRISNVTTVEASLLLQKAIASEKQSSGRPAQVIHRTISAEEHDSAGNRLIARHRIEMWQSADRGVKIQRLYDEQNRLIAAEWQRTDGSSKYYYRVGAPSAKRTVPSRSETSVEHEHQTVWSEALVMQSFAMVVGPAKAIVKEQATIYHLDYQLPPDGVSGLGGRVLKATLTLEKGELRPIAQTLLMEVRERDSQLTARGSDRNPQLREYRFTESSYERLAPNTVTDAVFQPDATLFVSTGSPIETTTTTTAANEAIQKSPGIIPGNSTGQLTDLELAELTVEARYLLDQANANLGEQVSVTSTPEKKLLLRALVETEQRKSELLAALAPLRNKPGVIMDVATYAEASRRQPPRQTSPLVISEAEITQRQIPASADLHRYFAAQITQAPQLSGGRPSEVWIEEQVARFANRIQGRVGLPLRHAWALNHLIKQVPSEELPKLSPEAKDKWRQMAQSHARTIQRETERLRLDLEPIFFSTLPAESAPSGLEIGDQTDLQQIIERLIELTAAHDEIIGKAFSKSPQNTTSAPLLTAQFWNSLRTVERLAAKVLSQQAMR